MRSPRLVGLGLIGAFALTGCGGALASTPVPAPRATPTHSVQVSATFAAGSGTAITYDPALVPVGSRGAVSSRSTDGGTTVVLVVRGLEPNRRQGAHAHAEQCGENGDAGDPHFQNQVDPVQPGADPAYANPRNEIGLDLTTDAAGAGGATATVGWGRNRRAGSVVITRRRRRRARAKRGWRAPAPPA